MRIFYDSTIDSLYFHLSERPSVRSDEVNNGVVLDYDENRIFVGIGVQHTTQPADTLRQTRDFASAAERVAGNMIDSMLQLAPVNCTNFPPSLKPVTGYAWQFLFICWRDYKLRIERHRAVVTDRLNHAAGTPLFERMTGLNDSYGTPVVSVMWNRITAATYPYCILRESSAGTHVADNWPLRLVRVRLLFILAVIDHVAARFTLSRAE